MIPFQKILLALMFTVVDVLNFSRNLGKLGTISIMSKCMLSAIPSMMLFNLKIEEFW